MDESTEEFEPLFDYTRVQPNFVCLDDDDVELNVFPANSPKRRKVEEEKDGKEKVLQLVDADDNDEDWLLPPPILSRDAQKSPFENSAIKELRSMKQELVSFAKSAKDGLLAMEESTKKDLGRYTKSSSENVDEQATKPTIERSKIVVSIQDKEGVQQFRIYMDEKFERLFKMYADKVKLDRQLLVFRFDGDTVSPAATPDSLGMEDEDIIEVHVKSK